MIESSNTHAHFEMFSYGFHLTCYPLFLGSNCTPDVMLYFIPASSVAACVFQYFSSLKTFLRSIWVSDTIFKVNHHVLHQANDRGDIPWSTIILIDVDKQKLI